MRQFKTFSALGLFALGLAVPLSAAHAGPITLGSSLGNPNNNILAQSHITVTRNINASSNISVTNSVNGVAVDYGLSGASNLNALNNANNFAGGVNASRSSAATTLEVEVLGAVGIAN